MCSPCLPERIIVRTTKRFMENNYGKNIRLDRAITEG
jgi:hypothetical protein